MGPVSLKGSLAMPQKIPWACADTVGMWRHSGHVQTQWACGDTWARADTVGTCRHSGHMQTQWARADTWAHADTVGMCRHSGDSYRVNHSLLDLHISASKITRFTVTSLPANLIVLSQVTCMNTQGVCMPPLY